MSGPRSTAVLSAAVAAWGLPSAHRLPTVPMPDDGFGELVAACRQQRILGLLGAAVADGAFPTTGAQRHQLDLGWQEWLGHAVRAERLALTVRDALAAVDIPVRVLKGLALAHTAYPDPALRVYGDIDLLVPSDRLHRAGAELVAALDGERAEPEVRPGFDDRFGREVMVRAAGVEIDLHRTLVNGAYGVRIPLPTLFEGAESVAVGGGTLEVLPAVPRLLHAAYQSTLADWPPRLVAFRDLAQVLVHDAPDLDALVDTARDWRGTAVLAAGVRAAWRTLRGTTRPPLVDWAERHHARADDRLLIAAARGRARGYTAGVTTLLAVPGVRNRAAYLRAVLAPSTEYRAARGLGPLALLGAGTRRARRG